MPERRYVTGKEDLAFSASAGGLTLSSSFLGLYITYFYVSVFGIDAGIVATVLFIVGIWDAVNDPMMGAVIDKTRTRWGKLRPFLLGVPLPLMVVCVLVFTGPMIFPDDGPTSVRKIAYMVVTYVLWEFFATIADVPFWGITASSSPSPDDRSRMLSHAKLVNGLMGNIPTIAVPIFIDLSTHGMLGFSLQKVFFALGLVFAVVGMGLFSIAGYTVKERIVQTVERTKIKDSIKYLLSNKPLLFLVAFNVIGQFCNFSGIFTTYYYIDVLGSMSISLIIGTPGTVIGFLSYLIVPKLQRRFSNKQLMYAATIWNAISFTALFLIGRGRADNMALMVPTLMIQGASISFFLGVKAVVPTQMLCETIDYMEWKNGIRAEGITFSMLNLMNKLGGNVARSIGLFFLSKIGYVASSTSQVVVQSKTTKNGIWLMYTLVPYLCGLISLIPLIFYDLTGKKREQMFRELDERRRQSVKEIEAQ